MSSAVCKRSSLIAIVNRLYLNANNDQGTVYDETVDGSKKEEDETEEVENQGNSEICSREASKSPKNGKIKTVSPPNLTTPSVIIPLSSEIASNGLSAIGGCRQCSRTFNDRLSLIHHFVDHFPTIFYSFESSSSSTAMVPLIPIMPSATTSSALGISSSSASNVSQIAQQNSLTTKNNFAHQQYASGIQSMMFFPYISMNNNNNSNHQHQQQQHSQSHQSQQQQTQKIKDTSDATIVMKKKKDNKTKSNQGNENIKETSSRFTDFNKTSNDLPYDMCPHCCQTFSDHSIYSEHLKTHDTPIITLGSPMTSESPLKCEYCDLRFSNEYLLKEHKKIHCRICSICSKTLMTAFDLNLHMGIHSGFSYDCKDCGRCFPDRKALALHNKMHRSDLSTQDSDASYFFEEKNTQKTAAATTALLKENVKKPKIEKSSPPFSAEDKPESFFKNNPYFENIFKQNPRKRRQRLHRSGTGEVATENSNLQPKKKSKSG